MADVRLPAPVAAGPRSAVRFSLGSVALGGAALVLTIQASNAWLWIGDSQAGTAVRHGNDALQAVSLATCLALLPGLILLARRLAALDILLLCLCATLVLSTALSGGGIGDMPKSVSVLLFASSAIVLRLILGDGALRIVARLMLLLLVAGFAASLSGIGIMSGEHEGLWRGVFEHKNRFGQFSAVCALLALYLYRDGRLSMPALIALLALSGACLVGSGSVTAMTCAAAAAVLSLALGALARIRMTRDVRVWLAFAVLLAAGLLAWGLLSGLADIAGRDESLNSRVRVWAFFARFIIERPWFGWGVQTDAVRTIILPEARGLFWPTIGTTHNGYLQVALEGGALSCALLAVHVGALLRQAVRDYLTRFDARAALALHLTLFFLAAMVAESINGITVSLFLLLIPLLHARGTGLPSAP